jgi:hypothetical protein
MKKISISDDEIRVLGQDWKTEEKASSNRKYRVYKKNPTERKWLLWLIIIVFVIIAALATLYLFRTKGVDNNNLLHSDDQSVFLTAQPESEAKRGYIEITEETVNDIPLVIYVPRNAIPELTLGLPDEADSTVIFVAGAADVGENNYNIVGDFVLAGEQLARGISKIGFCAIINQVITVGVDTKTPLLQEAVHKKGYFFRQYPLVKDGMPVDNKPKGKSIRKALAIREGQVLMIASRDRESFHDFAQALSDSGISDAIYLVGSDSYGWYVDEQGKQMTFGVKREPRWEGMNYLVWRMEK